MENGIVEDGFERLQCGQKELTLESLEKKYAKELAAAEPHEKELIYQHMQNELLRQKNHKPSPYTLW